MKVVPPVPITPTELLLTNVPETEHAAWSAATTYAVGARAQKNHRIYESAVAGNLNHDPELDVEGLYWLEVGATNPYRMFDLRVSSQTSNPGSVDVTIAPPGRVDIIAALNVSALTAQIIQTSVDGVTFDQTFDLVVDGAITDWYEYFFNGFERQTDLVVTNIPVYSDATYRVIFTEADGTAYVGQLLFGFGRDLGGTKWDATVGIIDFSIKERTDFGDYIVTERAYARRLNATCIMATSAVSGHQNFLAQYRATPVLWIADTDIGALTVYGFYKEFEIDVATPDVSFCTLEAEGLT